MYKLIIKELNNFEPIFIKEFEEFDILQNYIYNFQKIASKDKKRKKFKYLFSIETNQPFVVDFD